MNNNRATLMLNNSRTRYVEDGVEPCPSSITLNPYASEVPPRFPSYRHGSHKHRMYVTFSTGNHMCDNVMCRRTVPHLETIFRCFACDYDLCQVCFRLNFQGDPEPLETPNFDDRVFTHPLCVLCPDSPDDLPGLEPVGIHNNHENLDDLSSSDSESTEEI